MKLLNRISLLQFFLYEREDLDVGRNTAFLGPNGTGKTCLLDAVQTVMLGADTQRVHFNAQADGKRRDRSLRSYCLGIYDQSEHGRCRDISNTYISLVFRDEDTGEVVTAGVALSARVDAVEHSFHGLYILPGVDLTSADLVEALPDGQVRVLPWKDAQYRLKALVDEAGSTRTSLITQNREEFVRKLLIDHLAAPGDKPNPLMFRNAFQRSLQLKVMDDLSTALRDNLIQASPTNIREFKVGLDQFRKMRELVLRIREQIESAQAVGREYVKVKTQRTRQANLLSLAATVEVEAAGSESAHQQDQLVELEARMTGAKAEGQRAKAELERATHADRQAREDRARDLGYQNRAEVTGQLHEREKAARLANDTLSNELNGMLRAVASASRQAALKADNAQFELAGTHISRALGQLEARSLPQDEDINALAQAVARAAHLSGRATHTLDVAHQELSAEADAARRALARTTQGLSRLADPVDLVQRRLQEANIEAIPVCDLVQVSESRWQAAMEAYLGLNAQALLVKRDDEERAVRVYRQMKKNLPIYGAKIAAPSRLRHWRAQEPGLLAASLIEGSNADAVAYLRGELGQVECVETEAQLLASRRAITDDGMVAGGGGIDRRRLPVDLQIGRQDRQASRQLAEQQYRQLSEQLEQSNRVLTAHRQATQALSTYGSAEAITQRLTGLTIVLQTQWADLDDVQQRLAASTSSEVASLDERVRLTELALNKANEQALYWSNELVRVELLQDQATRALATAEQMLRTAREREKASWQDPLYDSAEVDRLREKLEQHYAEAAPSVLVDHCRARAQQLGDKAQQAEVEAGTLLSRYRIEFSVNADIAGDWVSRAAFIKQEEERLVTLTLAEKEAEAEQALKAAERVFRTDVVQSLLAGFDRVKEQISALNQVLKKAPEFSNRERYFFRHHVVDAYRPLYEFLQRLKEVDQQDAIWEKAEGLPPEFRELIEADASSPLLQDSSPLQDYRRFFSFDIDILRDGESIGVLSKRFGPGSGGEHRTPLYVIFGAALAAAYGNLHGRNAGGGLMLLDEAFDKMDATNVRAVADYLNTLGLQLLMAGPETDQPKLSGFLDVYYDMARHGSRTIHLERYTLSAAARELLASDNPLYHPDLILREMQRLHGNQGAPG